MPNEAFIQSIPTFVNGLPASELSVFDRGLTYGDGVFETLLAVGTQIPLKQFHWQRLERGCKKLNLKMNWKLLEQSIHKVLTLKSSKNPAETLKKSILKIIITRGISTRGYRPEKNTNATHIAQLFDYPLERELKTIDAIDVCICQHRMGINPALAGIKHLNRLDNVLASSEIDCEKHQDGLVFDINEHLVESIARNVFLVQNSSVITPKLDQCGVDGVFKQALAENYAEKLSLKYSERKIVKSDLFEADEIFLANSIRGVSIVNSIDGTEVSRGSIAGRIHDFWRQDIKERCSND